MSDSRASDYERLGITGIVLRERYLVAFFEIAQAVNGDCDCIHHQAIAVVPLPVGIVTASDATVGSG